MAEYITSKEIRIPKGTRLQFPEWPKREPVTYGHAVIDARLSDKIDEVNTHFAIPLDAALKAGLVERIE